MRVKSFNGKPWALDKLIREDGNRAIAPVWMALCAMADKTGVVFPTRERISEISGIDNHSSISRALTRLHNAGWLKIVTNPIVTAGGGIIKVLKVYLKAPVGGFIKNSDKDTNDAEKPHTVSQKRQETPILRDVKEVMVGRLDDIEVHRPIIRVLKDAMIETTEDQLIILVKSEADKLVLKRADDMFLGVNGFMDIRVKVQKGA
jgi:hypothetical protein